MLAISRSWLARATAGSSPDARRELPSLTPLRGIAAMAVLLYHSSFLAYHFGGGAPPGICRRGYLAVDLFFFLSGFVLTHVYGSRLAANRDWPAIGWFLWARFCRIYPAALFTTAVYVLKHSIGQFDMPAGVSFKTQLIAALFLKVTPFEFGLIGTVEFLPFILLSLPAGVWVDRLHRRPILIVGDLGRAVSLLSIPIAFELNVLTIWQLYAVGFKIGRAHV